MKKMIITPILFLFLLCGPGQSQNGAKAELKKWIQEGALVVDVRTPGEFSAGHYKNAKNIPLQELEQRLSEFGDKEQKIVLYCRSGARASAAKRILEQNGYKHVVNAGGLHDMP